VKKPVVRVAVSVNGIGMNLNEWKIDMVAKIIAEQCSTQEEVAFQIKKYWSWMNDE
jgi:hypothetical protein